MSASYVVTETGNFVDVESGALVVTAPFPLLPLCLLTFQDILGDPLPARCMVQIFNAGDPPTAVPLASGYLGVGSSLTANLQPGNIYRAQYAGDKAPQLATAFIAATEVTVVPDNYVSPWGNQNGYATMQSLIFPRNRTATSALQPGGGEYVMLKAFAAVLAQLDVFNRQTDAGLRLLSCVGTQIGSWANDFFGETFPPMSGETDAQYIFRISHWLQQPFTTLSAIAEQVQAYFSEFPDGSTYQLVFDRMSDPARATYYGLQPGQIAILGNFQTSSGSGPQWWLGAPTNGFLGQTTFLVNTIGSNNFTSSLVSPYPELAILVNRVKAGGTVPVYIKVFNEPASIG